ncbi:related to a putative low-affinity copper transport protein [Cephalotrichum gorgonifer]|uniref:Copper transport protein n=1 Tax=Cephalotrichum gorgonifer TaxID=2041049 RepID=A0AAE8STT8_9PEZI|nr:related to a putative low-affinity copper transport protein [Cephalotrichum gorgonifer]
MDHSSHHHMDHAAMGHGDMDHGDGGMDMCSMSMLLNWDTKNVCIVSSQWHIRTTFGLILSLIAVVAIAAGYEGLRSVSRKYELAVAKRAGFAPISPESGDHDINETSPFLPSGQAQPQLDRRTHIIKAALYAIQNFYAFMLM